MPAEIEPEEPIPFREFRRAHTRGQAHIVIDDQAVAGPGIRALLPRYYMVETVVKGALVPCLFIVLALVLIHAEKFDLSAILEDPKNRYSALLIVVIALPFVLFGLLRRIYLRHRILTDEAVYRRAIETGSITISLDDR